MFTFSIDDDYAALSEHMSSLARLAPVVHINAAQCGLVLERMRALFETLHCHSETRRPAPQIVTLFRSADALVQRMHYTWQQDLRRYFTCRALFTGLFDRMQCVCCAQATSHWAEEHRAAVEADETANTALFSLLLRADETFTAHMYRQRERSAWKVPLDALFSAEGEALTTAAMPLPTPHLIFANACPSGDASFMYDGDPVTLTVLNPMEPRITPETLTCFVQDMVCRARWCHPCVLPHVGAFTEVFACHTGTSKGKGEVQLALGVIAAEPAALAAAVVRSAAPLPLLRRGPSNAMGANAYVSLHELLFVRGERFSLHAAVGIARQVADALQYMLMDDVPEEVAYTRCAVAPSHIFVSPVRSNRSGGDTCADMSADDACVFAALYTPPVYVANGPFSRWRPHPHAAVPASYAIAQLMLALLTNHPPYRSLARQSALADRVFAPAGSGATVRVNIPCGVAVPRAAPRGIRQLCVRAMALRSPRPGAPEPRGAISLEALREELAAAASALPHKEMEREREREREMEMEEAEEEGEREAPMRWECGSEGEGGGAVAVELHSRFEFTGDYGILSSDDESDSSEY